MTTLLVASGGGHLKELHLLLRRLPHVGRDRVWVTWDTPQSRSLLVGEEVVYARYAQPRDAIAMLANGSLAWSVLRARQFDGLITTGSALAVSFVAPARALGVPCHYIESITRTKGPSLSARLVAALPGVSLHTQHQRWEGRRWRFAGSVLDEFEPGPSRPDRGLNRMVVTVGTTERYGFRALVERLVEVVPAGVEVLWQTGSTKVDDLPIRGRAMVAADELHAALVASDVVVAHAGAGSSLGALEAGLCPVLVPRRRAYGEHIDDHQAQIAEDVAHRQLAVVRGPDELTFDDIVGAARRSTARRASPPPLVLVP